MASKATFPKFNPKDKEDVADKKAGKWSPKEEAAEMKKKGGKKK